MEIRYNRTGAERKELVNAIVEIVGQPAVYQGAPSFAYAVGLYRVDKDGTVFSEDATGLASLFDALTSRGYTGQIDEADEGVLEQEVCDSAGERMAIEYPIEGLSPENQQNLEKLVESKAMLIKKVLGADSLPIETVSDVLRFPWFPSGAGAEDMEAYRLFVQALCETARNQKRVTAEPRAVENEKYAFRCFLLRLGFIGAEYKAARKVLMRGLSGDGSFKKSKEESSTPSADV